MTTLCIDFKSDDMLPLGRLRTVENNKGISRTREQMEFNKSFQEAKAAASSTVVYGKLFNKVKELYDEQEFYFKKRSEIVDNVFKRLFFKRELAEINNILDEIGLKIYEIEFEPTKQLIAAAEQKLKQYDSILKVKRNQNGSYRKKI